MKELKFLKKQGFKRKRKHNFDDDLDEFEEKVKELLF
jgi:hypothetical protein